MAICYQLIFQQQKPATQVMDQSLKISAEERKRLDRQRFLGLETQKKLLSSRILITPLNGPNTELAKNLILAGVNVTIYDSSIVTEDDFETNFLVGLEEIGRSRGEVIFNRLRHMNPSGSNEYINERIEVGKIQQSFLSRFTIICTSFTDFPVIEAWDSLTKKVNKPYYNIVSAGLYSFCYISLGSTYSYKQPPTKPGAKAYSIECLSFSECLDVIEVRKARKKQYDMLQAILMMKEAQEKGLNYDPFDPMKMHEEMLSCMIDLGEDIREPISRELLVNFAKMYGIDYCPVYSVVGSIVSQEIIKVVENQQEPGMNWLVMNSVEGYSCVLKLKKQELRTTATLVEVQTF